MIEITAEVERILRESESKEGVCILFTQHTTCGLTIN
ncbi:MAG: YjbQ family protein, partial [Pyrinomonadaceae bacterium]